MNIAWLLASDSGAITVDERTYPSPSDLTGMLTERKAGNPAIRVLVRADKETRYEFLRAVMVAIAQAQIANVTFSVVDKAGAKTASTATP